MVRNLLLFYFIGYVCIEYKYFSLGHAWVYGDWLINYSGGFVRRGLIGSLLISGVGLNPGQLLFLLKIIMYALILFFISDSVKNEEQNAYFPILISPALLLFPINDFPAIGRKEYLFFLLSAFLVWRISRGKKINFTIVYVVVYPIFILSHEMLILSLPFVMCLDVGDRNFNFRLILDSIFKSLPSFILFIICLIFKDGDVDLIHQAVLDAGYNLDEGGALKALGMDTKYYTNIILSNLGSAYTYVCFFLLSTVSFFYIRDKFFKLTTTKIVLISSSFFGFFVLSFVAIDYGRWLHIFMMGLFFITLNESSDKAKECRIDRFKFALILVYSFSWGIPHFLSDTVVPYPVVVKIIGKLFTI